MEKKRSRVVFRQLEKRAGRLLTALCLTILAAASAEAAKRPSGAEAPLPQLYALDKAVPPPAGRPLVPDAAEELVIQVDPAMVKENPPAFTLDLPGHEPMEAVRTNFVDYQPGWKSWFGALRYADKEEAVGSIYVGFHGDRITALIELDAGERFRIVGGPEESQRLVRLDPELSAPPCGLEDTAADAVEPPLEHRRKSRAGLTSATEKILSCAASARIDVLVVYPAAAVAGSGELGYFQRSASDENALFTFVHNSIVRANQVFINSGINASYWLVGIVPLLNQDDPADPPVPSSGLRDVHEWLNEEHTEFVNLRNAFGADVVALYTPFDWEGTAGTNDRACGVANELRQNGAFRVTYDSLDHPGMQGRAYSAHRDNCGLDDLTLAHEIGHNYGMRHDTDSDDPMDAFAWGKGYVFTDTTNNQQRATVMGCGPCPVGGCVAGPNPVCSRISFFSDPDKMYGNTSVPIGTSGHHNARVACDQVATYAAFKPQSTNTPPNASFTVSCTGLSCYFNANGTTDNAAIPSNSFWWDFGNGTGLVRADRSVTYLYNAAGSYRVHLVVKDSGGQTDVAWATANPWNPVHEGYVENANCRFISGWAWDQTHPNDSISVNIYRDGTYLKNQPANIFRQDLVNAGKGNGYHGFSYTPTSSWKDGEWHSAGVRFGGANTSHLTWSPKSIICNARIFSNSYTPAENLSTGGQVYTVGLQFSSNKNGYITQLGFYRAAGETGSNTLRLWPDGGGTPLVSVTTNCTSSGWCWGSFSPIAITAGTRYRVTVNTNTYQSKTGCGIGSGITNDPLTAHNGYWIAGTGFPTGQGACNSNFFLDVKFDI